MIYTYTILNNTKFRFNGSLQLLSTFCLENYNIFYKPTVVMFSQGKPRTVFYRMIS